MSRRTRRAAQRYVWITYGQARKRKRPLISGGANTNTNKEAPPYGWGRKAGGPVPLTPGLVLTGVRKSCPIGHGITIR